MCDVRCSVRCSVRCISAVSWCRSPAGPACPMLALVAECECWPVNSQHHTVTVTTVTWGTRRGTERWRTGTRSREVKGAEQRKPPLCLSVKPAMVRVSGRCQLGTLSSPCSPAAQTTTTRQSWAISGEYFYF